MTLIQLTNHDGRTLWVRANAIAAICYGDSHTHVWLNGINEEFTVEEHPGQIIPLMEKYNDPSRD